MIALNDMRSHIWRHYAGLVPILCLLVWPVADLANVHTPPDHAEWSSLLSEYVNKEGMVDYAAFKEDEGALDAYLKTLAENPPSESWTDDDEKAYWINAYNAFTVKLILKHYPVNSIRDLDNGNPWDVQWIRIGNTSLSLNEIEKEKLLQRFGDPLIHFAVNCAATSCPPLMAQAYEADYLDMRLHRRTSKFINNPEYNRLDPQVIIISRIFEWYKDEFDPLVSFLNRYTEQRLPEHIEIRYHPYDWSLNSQ
jgi:hypothetical protein